LKEIRFSLLNLTVWISGGAVFTIGCTLNIGGVKAGKIIHRNLLNTIMAAPMLFFDSTPVGRILNRFAHDTDIVDINVPRNMRGLIFQILRTITIPIVIGYSTPMFLTIVVPLCLIYYIVQVRPSVSQCHQHVPLLL
jgi:ABC-type multidrug transport system fused ATPase/permease subunit